jgi:peptidoglycan/xylan/chitin deacetylase (PgdA/CDA1 family)
MEPKLFDDFLAWLKQRFSIVVFGDIATLPRGGKPPVILSFDDGYKDFIEFAVPILEKHRVRVNHNIIPSVVESGRPPMNVALQNFIVSAPAGLLRETLLPGLPNGADPDDRIQSCLRASAALKNRPIAQQKAIFRTLEMEFARFDGFQETTVMTLEDIRQISEMHEIGAHSFEHASMEFETDDYLRNDARRCRQYFETELGLEAKVFAFPNGSARPGQPEIVSACGFNHVLMVGETYSQPDAWLHSRFSLHARTPVEARARALGWFNRRSYTDAG